MYKRTTVGFQTVDLDEHMVTIYDNEWYGEVHLQFETLAQAKQCYDDTVVILIEAHTKLTAAGWSQARDWDEPHEVVYNA